MNIPGYQSNKTTAIEGKITLLSYQKGIDKKPVELSLFELVTAEGKLFTFSNCSQKCFNSNSTNILLDSISLRFLDEYIQNYDCRINKISIVFKEENLISIKAIKEKAIPPVIQKISRELKFAIKKNINIEIFCNSKLSSRYKDAFYLAASRWSEILIGGHPKSRMNTDIPESLIIEVFTSYIDGPGKILGGARPIDIKAGWSLPNAGWMILDSSDIELMHDQGILVNVILHEIGHLLGLGTLWQILGLTQGIGTDNPVFIGKKTMSEFARLIGSSTPTPVPIEDTGGLGTRDCHWRESVFGNELMTGFMGSKTNPISCLTIAALEDIGYQVNYDAADFYAIQEISNLEFLDSSQQDISNIYCSIR